MTILEDIQNKFGKYYIGYAKCNNCEHFQEVKIPKGQIKEEFIKSERAICENCGCSNLVPHKKKKEDESTKED